MISGMSEAAVSSSGHIDLSAEARAALHLNLVRSLDVEVLADGVVLLRGRDPGQAWFWTPEWQDGELEADADQAAGRVGVFDTDEDLDRRLAEIPLDERPRCADVRGSRSLPP